MKIILSSKYKESSCTTDDGKNIPFFDIDIRQKIGELPSVHLSTLIRSTADVEINGADIIIHGVPQSKKVGEQLYKDLKQVYEPELLHDFCDRGHEAITFISGRECPLCSALQSLHKLADEAMKVQGDKELLEDGYKKIVTVLLESTQEELSTLLNIIKSDTELMTDSSSDEIYAFILNKFQQATR
jgi:hypothetical protein